MDPKEKLKELEAAVIQKGLLQLEALAALVTEKGIVAPSKLKHLEECVKLAHRMRSLLGVA